MATPPMANSEALRRTIAGILHTCDREPIEALRQARAMVKDWPELPAARRLLAFTLRRAKREREADLVDVEAISLAEQQPGPRAAQDAWAAGEWESAERLIRDHLKRDPEDAGAAKMLADIAVRFGALREAEIFYNRALMLAPGYHDARLTLAMLFSRTGRPEEAMAKTDEVIDRDAEHVGALSFKAGLLMQARRLGEAEKLFRKLIARHPRNATTWLTYAHLLKTVGRPDESIDAYRRAIASEKDNGLAWFGLANLKTAKFSDADIETMREVLSLPGTTDEQRLHIHFALGKALDGRGDYAAAFEQYELGSALRRTRAPYDADARSAETRKIERVFSPALLAKPTGSQHRDPIFIVSLPRSGSTLVEQILASHPQIEGTEELYEIEGIARTIGHGTSHNAYLDEIADLSEAQAQALGERYIERTRRYRVSGRPYFTDKMPGNWEFTGLIHKILPNAKIIDIRRHPMSCGFANFSQHFNWGIDWSYSLDNIGRFYSDYVRQMAHFDRVLPGRVHRVHYEDLVENLEGEVRRLLDYLELPFDEACLRFYENTRAVHTPSAEQVRRPINRDGMETWRHYEPWLDPLKSALGPVLDLYPAVPTAWPE